MLLKAIGDLERIGDHALNILESAEELSQKKLQRGGCSIETGFVWFDLLTALKRIGDRCSNIAGCVIDQHHHNRNTHKALRSARVENEYFAEQYRIYAETFKLNG